MALPYNARILQDADLNVAGTLPNAANTTCTNVIDLGSTTPFPVTEQFTVKISRTVSTGANNKNLNIRVMDSADNSNWANVAVIANPVLRGTDAANSSALYPAAAVTISLPPTIQRYLKAVAVGEADGGNSANGTYNCQLLF